MISLWNLVGAMAAAATLIQVIVDLASPHSRGERCVTTRERSPGTSRSSLMLRHGPKA